MLDWANAGSENAARVRRILLVIRLIVQCGGRVVGARYNWTQGAALGPNRPQPSRSGPPSMAARSADRYFELKSQIHRKLIGVLALDRVSSIPKDRVRAEIGRVVERLLDEERVPMTTAEQTKIVEEVLDEVLGLGPLETLLKEPTISDILVNRYNKVYIERNGKLSETTVRFKDDAHLL